MRILFDQAVHDQKNVGNNALLEVAWMRLKEFWPDATFDVITIAPHFSRAYFPGLYPVSPDGLQINNRLDIAHKVLPKLLWKLVFELRDLMNEKSGLSLEYGRQRTNGTTTPPPGNAEIADGIKPSLENSVNDSSNQVPASANLFLDNISTYDLYIATGGGYMCDSDKRFLLPLFDRMEIANTRGVHTAFVGQGVGPIDDPDIIARARDVLPKMDYLFIREEKLTRPLLASMDVSQDKVLMTGDDAIELAYRSRKKGLGNGIGLSLRVTSYTDVNREHIQSIRSVVLAAANKYTAELVAAPIDANEDDLKYILEVCAGYPKFKKSWKKFESSADVVQRISRCRIMISGTFHGAVFAISQGIPVIALAKSTEYLNKISGLAAEFGEEGCQIISLHDADFADQLARAIEFAWSSADSLRPTLLERAKDQVDLGCNAYQRIYSLMESARTE